MSSEQLEMRSRTLSKVALVLFLVGYATANLAGRTQQPRPFEHQLVASALAEPMANGDKLSRWIQHNIPRGAVLVADDGQATAYLLKRDTVSLVARKYSDLVWDEQQVDAAMRTFGADYIIVYPGLPASSAPAEFESDFLHSLGWGRSPSWLELAAQNARVKIFRRRHTLVTASTSNAHH